MNIRHTLTQAGIIAGVLAASVGLQALAAFTQPSTSPPNSDAYAPLTTSDYAQAKVGGLLLNTGGAANGLVVQSGNVGVGTTSPTEPLSVNGIIQSASGGIMFPDGTVQTTAASGGTSYSAGSGISISSSNVISADLSKASVVYSCPVKIDTNAVNDGAYACPSTCVGQLTTSATCSYTTNDGLSSCASQFTNTLSCTSVGYIVQ